MSGAYDDFKMRNIRPRENEKKDEYIYVYEKNQMNAGNERMKHGKMESKVISTS